MQEPILAKELLIAFFDKHLWNTHLPGAVQAINMNKEESRPFCPHCRVTLSLWKPLCLDTHDPDFALIVHGEVFVQR